MKVSITSTDVNTADACCTPLRRETLNADEALELAEAFKALSDPVRLRLLNLIATTDGGEACVCDLVDAVDRSQPTVSHHLKVLRDAGLVSAERRGTWVWYTANGKRLDQLRQVMGRR